MTDARDNSSTQTVPVVGTPAPAIPMIQATSLFGRGNMVVIEHRGERYQLRLTRGGKLILTK